MDHNDQVTGGLDMGGLSDEDRPPNWRFCLQVYAGSEVPKACLYLQDILGLDVNVLLGVAFAAYTQNLNLSQEDIGLLDVSVKHLREGVVRPLRDVRRLLKTEDWGPTAEAVRQGVKKFELLAEKLEQEMLFEHLSAHFYAPLSEPPHHSLHRAVTFYARLSPNYAKFSSAGSSRKIAAAIATIDARALLVADGIV